MQNKENKRRKKRKEKQENMSGFDELARPTKGPRREKLGLAERAKTEISKDMALALEGIYDRLENLEDYYVDPATGEWVRIDMVLVHRIRNSNDTKEVQQRREKFEENLRANGIKMVKVRSTFESRDKSEKIFTLCTVENYKLVEQTARFNWRMPLIQTEYKQRQVPTLSKCLAPINFPDKPEIYDPYKYFRAPFSKTKMALFPLDQMGVDNFITDSERSRIAHYVISHTEQPVAKQQKQKGKQQIEVPHLGIESLIKSHLYTDAYPVHTGPYLWQKHEAKVYGQWQENTAYLTDRQKLHYSWSSRQSFFKSQPLEQVRRYFGEKTGLYFAWLGFYARWMFFPAMFGVITFFCGVLLLFFDPVVEEACSEQPKPDLVLCPTCDYCDFSLINSACQQVKFARLFDNPMTVLMAIFISVWAVLCLEYWKREQNCLSYEWDLFTSTEVSKIVRPEFLDFVKQNFVFHKKDQKHSEWRRESPIDGKMEYVIPKHVKNVRTVLSSLLVLVTLIAVFGLFCFMMLVGAILTYGISQSSSNASISDQAGNISYGICTVSTVIIIEILNVVLGKICTKITQMEQHKTQFQFEESFSNKMFLFQFTNNYSAIIYLAFFKSKFVGYPGSYNRVFGQRQEQCGLAGCITEVAFELALVMIGLELIANVKEIGIIFFRNRRLRRRHVQKIEAHVGSIGCWEEDFYLTGQDDLYLFEEYLEQVIQFGFATLFATAFPLAPFIAFCNAWLEINIDAFKFTTQLRRPCPEKVQNVGPWFNILQAIAIVAVLTNACIVAFTSQFLDNLYYRSGHFDKMYEYGVSENHNLTFLEFVSSRTNWQSTEGVTLDSELARAAEQICRYPDMRYPNGSPNELERTSVYWHLVAVKLGFVFLFENFIVALSIILKMCVPDMPSKVKEKKSRENFLVKQKLDPHNEASAVTEEV